MENSQAQSSLQFNDSTVNTDEDGLVRIEPCLTEFDDFRGSGKIQRKMLLIILTLAVIRKGLTFYGLHSKRHIVTLSGFKNVVEGAWKAVADDFLFVKIHGCRADETTLNILLDPVDPLQLLHLLTSFQNPKNVYVYGNLCCGCFSINYELKVFEKKIVKDQDLSGKTCLITGANSGIGLELTRCLNSRGCKVLMACRNPYATTAVVKHVCDNHDLLQFYETNLASLQSVEACSDIILEKEKKIDIVFLNAAVFGLPWTLTEDGLETTFQVNYLSQFYLLMNIEKCLAPDARVVIVSSESHRNINWDTQKYLTPTEELLSLPEHEYTSIKAYNISKLCGILAMHYLSYQWMHSQKQVFCAHPGSFVKTRLCRNWWVWEALYTCMQPFTKTVSQAASTPLYCATSPDLKGVSGIYFKNCERCQESEIASDLHLSFRINDLTRDLLRVRVGDAGEVGARAAAHDLPPKHTMDETVISNYSSTLNS